ncbi:MAG TPA: hypothetical protein VK663_13110, partial [Burkholderiales bacterium]|nr:hypothetical protein [Burkholderiales bacterium]
MKQQAKYFYSLSRLRERLSVSLRHWKLMLLLFAALAISLTAIRLWPKPPLSSRYTSSVAVYDARGQLLR